MRNRVKNEPFVQYVYHLRYPKNSIDVREISPSELAGIVGFYNECRKEMLEFDYLNSYGVSTYTLSTTTLFNYKVVEKMLRKWFPEELI